MKKIALILSAGLAFAGTSAFAQESQNASATQAETTPQQTEEEAEAQAHLDERVCRSEPVTGSRTRVNRTCMTRREWRALESRTRRDVDELQGRASGGIIPANPAAPPGS